MAGSSWLMMQLADSAFPTGGFAHSAGLEAACARGDVRDRDALARFVDEALWQAGTGALPFVREAVNGDFESLDRACDAFLLGTVTNRASRTQGRALVSTAARVFSDVGVLVRLAASARVMAMHLAPAFGAVCGALGVSSDDAQALFLHQTARQLVSSAVRLGVVGPHEAQRLQHAAAPTLDAVLSACRARRVADVAQTAPILELTANLHDALYARLFQS